MKDKEREQLQNTEGVGLWSGPPAAQELWHLLQGCHQPKSNLDGEH